MQWSRRGFLRTALAFGAEAMIAPALARPAWAAPAPDLVVVTGDSPARNCHAAVEALGGFARFVRPGDRVALKPNPVGHHPPEAAVNTHPEMVAEVVRGCLGVGAQEVVVLSHDGMRSFIGNGTLAAVNEAGGRVLALAEADQFREIPVARGKILRSERIAADVLDADVFINMPIAKHHAGAEVTLALKNLMGINWDRVHYHRTDLHQCIAELGTCVRHDLVIMDANHVLLTNGPVGPGEVRHARQVIAGTDPVAVDALAMREFFGTPDRARHVGIAHALGAGRMDLDRMDIRTIGA